MIRMACLLTGAILFHWADNWKEALPTVGQVMAGEKNSQGNISFHLESSGVVIDAKGIVVTNYHVIRNGDKPYPEVYFNLIDPQNPYKPPERSRLFKTEVLAQDSNLDLALLRITAHVDGRPIDPSMKFKAIPLGNSSALTFLDEIYTLGFPKAGGSSLTITKGQISGKEELEGWLKIDAQVTHGNSGGAAINRNGELIGIPTKVRPDVQEVDTNGDGFPDAVVNLGSVGLIRPVEYVRAILEQWRQGKTAAHPFVPEPNRLVIKGLVQSTEGASVSGALVGLLKPGSREATVENLLTWSRADENGVFQFPITLPPGPYTFRVRAEGYEIFLQSLPLNPENIHPVIMLRSLPPAPEQSYPVDRKPPNKNN